MLNVHPQPAMEVMNLPDDHPDRKDFVKFYEKISGIDA
jgi:hypothetical protein